jgi:adenylyltransferase/sulfurtransferase
VRNINPHVAVEAHNMRLTAENAEGLIAKYDVVLDGSDNFSTRYLVSDAAFRAKRPLVMGWLGTMDGAITTLRPYEDSKAKGVPNPTYRCLFPEPPPDGTIPTCEQAGVLGALAGVVGSMMALEAIREIAPFGEGLVGRLLMIDARSMRFETLNYAFDRANPLSGFQGGP